MPPVASVLADQEGSYDPATRADRAVRPAPKAGRAGHRAAIPALPLFLAGPLSLATAVASRDGDLLAYDSGEFFEHAGRVPASRLFDDDFTGRSPKTLVDVLADRGR